MTPASESSPYLDQYRRFVDGLEPMGTNWLQELREKGIRQFEKVGFPSAREEAWRFTSLKTLRKQAFTHEAGGDTPPTPKINHSFTGEHAAGLTFVTGFRNPVQPGGASEDVEVLSLSTVLSEKEDWVQARLGSLVDIERHRFGALNTGYLRDGVVVRVPKGSGRKEVVHLRYETPPQSSAPVNYPRVLVVAEEGTEVTILEEYVGGGDQTYFTNAVTEVFVENNAQVEHIKLQREGKAAFHIGSMAVRLERDSRFMGHSISLGGKLARTDIDVILAGEGGECVLNGLYLTREQQHVDHHTRVEHVAPHTTSREHYKGVLSGKSTGVFNGRLVIRPHAQKVEASQTNNNLILSKEALINTNPELEIFADDIKAQHGATIGQIEDEHLFYLRSRGIDREEARRILIYAFSKEIVDRIPVSELREGLAAHLDEVF